MTNEKRKLALYCLKANSDLHGEVCEECSQYPECDHFIQDNVMEELIEALEQQPCEDKIIEWKKDFKEYVNSLSMPRDDYKGIMEYIDELPVTSELREDAISREEAIGAVANLFEMSEYPHPYPQGKPIRLRDIKEKLKQVPPVQPKTGHWEPMWYDGYADGCPVWEAWDCSECGYEHNGLEDTLTNYCPNCGVKMESEKP
jgi:hypothetical protein